MESELKVQHRPGKKSSVADDLWRLQSYNIDERYLDKGILERYVEYAESIYSVDIVESGEVDALRKLTNDDLFEKHKEASCPIVMNQIGDNHSPYLTNDTGVLSRRSRLDGAEQHVVPGSLQQAILYYAHDPIVAGHTEVTRMYDMMRRLFY